MADSLFPHECFDSCGRTDQAGGTRLSLPPLRKLHEGGVRLLKQVGFSLTAPGLGGLAVAFSLLEADGSGRPVLTLLVCTDGHIS